MAFEEHERLTALAKHGQAWRSEAATDSLLLPDGAHPEGAEHEHVLKATRSIEDFVRVKDVADDFAVVFRNEGQVVVPRPRLAQSV